MFERAPDKSKLEQMKNVPQIVRQRLKADVSPSHPEANMLTAFAEQLLSKTERASVLAHLARCGECREVVALALPEIEASQTIGVPARSGWLSWSAFRWAVVTAGVAVIAIGGVEYQRHSRAELSARFVKAIPQAESVAPVLPQQAAVPSAAASSQPIEQKKDSAASPSNDADEKQQASAMASRAFSPKPRPQVGSRPEVGIHGIFAANNLATNHAEVGQQAAARSESAAHGSAAKEAPLQAGSEASTPPAVHGGAVQAQTANAETEIAQGAAPPAMFDRYAGAIGKAKPAITPAQDTNVPPAPRWSISPTGGLQRSYDQGMTWEDVNVSASTAAMGIGAMTTASSEAVPKSDLAPRKSNLKAANVPAAELVFRAVAANGADVWAGGSNGALYHSTDTGNHWTRVMPTASGMLLTGDIVGIDFSTQQTGSVSTSAGEVWTTVDGGQSWQKQ